MVPTLIIVNGYPRSGKSKFQEYLCDIAYENKLVPELHSTVDTVKDLFFEMGWDGEKTPKMREGLSELKDLYTKYFDGPLNEIKDMFELGVADLVVTTMREPKEIERTVRYCAKNDINCLTVFISRNSQETHHKSHSDKDVKNYPYMIYFENNGTTLGELRKEVGIFFEKCVYDGGNYE